MKLKQHFIPLVMIALLSCSYTDKTAVKNEQPPQASGRTLFTLPDAEKILGEPAHLADSSDGTKHAISVYQCSFAANAKDEKTGKTGNIYFLADRYPEAAAARAAYESIYTANVPNGGVKQLQGLGDAAYFHSDGENFYFIMVVKGNRSFRMKVNKITSHTSLDAFNEIAKKITAAL